MVGFWFVWLGFFWIGGFSGGVGLCGWVVLNVWCGFWLWQCQWLGWLFVDWVALVGYRSVCNKGFFGFFMAMEEFFGFFMAV